jgi:hypothetical protein
MGYGRDPQHTCDSSLGAQIPQMVRWKVPVDLHPPLSSGGELLIHYGTTVITRLNTVLVTVKTGTSDSFEINAYHGASGQLAWTMTSDYSVPTESGVWIPSCGSTLTPRDLRVVVPAAGGTVLVRAAPDSAGVTPTRIAFFGNTVYAANPTGFNSTVKICTPITSDGLGNLYFGFVTTGTPPAPLNGFSAGQGGIARISTTGAGTWLAATTAVNDSSIKKVAFNCAPGISLAGDTVYYAVNSGDFTQGYLVQANSTTLATQAQVKLMDPRTDRSAAAVISDSASASPTIGPDGDVYYGVLESSFPSHNARGWLLHFSANLGTTKTPGSFGWDDTPSIVPASVIPTYTGSSSYLVLTKYNNYAGVGSGDGVNKVAVLDPNAAMNDPISGASAQVMVEVVTVKGITPDSEHPTFPNAVREWCINSAAIDVTNKSAIINSEDGNLYRWNFVTNSLDSVVPLNNPIGEAYTPTIVGPDSAVYAINDAMLYSCIARPGVSGGVRPPRPVMPPGPPLLRERIRPPKR